MVPSAARRACRWLLLPLLVACEEPFDFNAPNPVATVILSPDSGQLVSGDQLQLVAVLLDSAGDTLHGRTLGWSALTPATVSVSQGGLVLGLLPGPATIVVAVEGVTDTARFGVVPLELRAVTAGELHTCAVGNNNRVYCWGWGIYGQLGVGTTPFQSVAPVPISGGRRYLLPSSGGNHTCAANTAGTIECWGRNNVLQLGRPAITDNTVPAPVEQIGGPVLFRPAAGDTYSCASTVDSAAWCWGDNSEGQLGDSAVATRALPAPVTGERAFASVAPGARHACAHTAAGAAWCWGANDRGQLGDSSAGGVRRFPAAVHGGLAFAALASGGAHSCGVLADQRVFCWGDNARGQLGTGGADSMVVVPTQVGSFAGIAVAAGRRHSCALAADSTAWCWGANDKGQVGDSTKSDRPAPVAVAGGLKFKQLAAGSEHNCGVTTAGLVYCWGAGGVGQLGNNGVADKDHPVQIVPP